jgi:two-component system sensor histidine kinase KdpD
MQAHPKPSGYLPHLQPLRPWGLVVALIGAATLGGFALDQQISLSSQAMLYVLAVVIAAYRVKPLPSVVGAVAAVTAFNFFFVPPRWTFEVDSQEHVVALLTMLAVALVISQLVARLRLEAAAARESALRAHQLQELATELAGSSTVEQVVQLGQAAWDARYDGPTTLAVLREDGSLDLGLATGTKVLEGLRTCIREAASLGPGTGRWPGLNAWYLPMGSAHQMQGAVCIENINAADNAGREHAQALCALLAQTLARIRITQAMLASQAEVQRQQLQGTFLSAISHDLRTPLAAVVGAASLLQSQGEKLGATERERLLGSIASEASYLSTITENTLQLVQLSNAAAPLQTDWESMEEIVGAVLGRIRLRDVNHRISAKVPSGLPLIEVDAVLIAQLLSNLLDNAMLYSPGAIELQVQVVRTATSSDGSSAMQARVKDRGAPIPAALQGHIFQPFSRGDQAGPRGSGLGLALCRTIASVHGGTLTLAARTGGGNCFTLTLPVNPQQPPEPPLPPLLPPPLPQPLPPPEALP